MSNHADDGLGMVVVERNIVLHNLGISIHDQFQGFFHFFNVPLRLHCIPDVPNSFPCVQLQCPEQVDEETQTNPS